MAQNICYRSTSAWVHVARVFENWGYFIQNTCVDSHIAVASFIQYTNWRCTIKSRISMVRFLFSTTHIYLIIGCDALTVIRKICCDITYSISIINKQLLKIGVEHCWLNRWAQLLKVEWKYGQNDRIEFILK